STSGLSAVVVPGVLTATPVPTVSGTPQVDATLTAEPGTWAPDGVQLSYQWFTGTTAADEVPVSGATASTYVPVEGDIGKRLAVEVTGSKLGYASTASTSVLGELVTPAPSIDAGTPTITGTAQVGRTLTADAGIWAPEGVELALQWLRDGTPVEGATSTTYALVGADVGRPVALRVTGTKPGFPTKVATSSETQAVAEGTQASTPTPTITGATGLGDVLTAVPGDWDTGVTVSYQWVRDGNALSGETAAQHTVTATDIGSSIRVTVTGTRAGYASQSVSSAPLPVTGAQTAGKIARALATFHAALGRVGTDPLDIFVGPSDSITEGNRASSIQKRWISVFRDGLRRSYQPSGVAGGFGYLDLMNSPKFPDNPSSYVNGAGVFDQGLGRQTLALFGATQTITVNDRFTDVDILYAGLTGTAGTFAYSVDGGPDVRVSTGGKAVSRGGYVERVSGLVAGPHRLVLHGGGGGYPSIIEGVMLYNGDRDRGIRLWEGGASGLTAVNYVAPTDAWAASLKEVHPDIVVLPIGSNDYALGTPAKDTEVRIREIIATIRARVDTDPSIVLVPYYERPTSGTAPWSTYEQMYARIASTDPKIVVFDLALLFGSYGSAQRVGLMSPDLLHPSDTGYALIADKLAAFVAPSPPG
ncbi:GDSL-type esterase/lipase family protein, partial [Aeromicrobium sp. Root344]|uniref:GDSL-type esterase/lipase family protein n=1 Tax=Aeromicrobium sp. Root344 TaxID=1736521 RepID=UPI001F31B369